MFGMCVIVKGIIWAAAVEPVIQMLGLGSLFAAWNISKKSNLYDDFLIKFDSVENDDAETEEQLRKNWELPLEYGPPTDAEKAH